jgi:cytochrome P450
VPLSILLLHHRADVYPDPFAFHPERFLGAKPGTYTWAPFGGGIRRCLGATLAMAEQRAGLRAVARRTDMSVADDGFGACPPPQCDDDPRRRRTRRDGLQDSPRKLTAGSDRVTIRTIVAEGRFAHFTLSPGK